MSDERKPGQVLSTRTIAVCSIGLMALAAGLAWLLLWQYGDGSAANNARLDGIRTVGTIVLGAGGAIALLLAARRQQTAERDLEEKRRDLAHKERVQQHTELIAAENMAHQQRVAAASEVDAEARRITDLYTKAVEQLGSEKAPVRLGGLYALERLAQDNESQRQTIVNVLCAYLRMPYDPADKNLENVQEQKVRLTAQNILTDHLSNYTQPVAATFWQDIDLNLVEATLVDFNLRSGRIRSGDFRNARFIKHTVFDGAAFTGDAQFTEAEFSGISYVSGVTFTQAAIFSDATFFEDVEFIRTRFLGDSSFHGALFSKGVVVPNNSTHVYMFENAWIRMAPREQRLLPPSLKPSSQPGMPRPDIEGDWRQLQDTTRRPVGES
ncbi:Pentapeptide repeat-containing protein [Amycolatopsis xylanica]|uniref:Pentapeptide repeat-containing protein n=1 Tax=Amycolatopsis xylanica TaxID=589385 RepID=A0A1H3R1R7_9PSEU|nr:pentapeptide repeat-containing protein [Amycolatopsis xylanica]SDZ19241.1 Pentapeptide repeat-containing protein [Amycolatopsis xylanica]